jgi:hypothetical protein
MTAFAGFFAEVARDRARVLGPDHPDTLTSRHQQASYLGRAGERRKAARLFAEVAGDRARVLGPEHPATILSRRMHARYSG